MSTTPRRFVLNAPSIAGDAANVQYKLLADDGTTLVAQTGAGVVALDAGYRVVVSYDSSWSAHGEFLWYYLGAEVAADTFDVGGAFTAGDRATLDATLAKLNAAGAQITVSNPVPARGGPVTIIRGRDYLASEGQALSWASTSGLDFSGATVAFVLYDAAASSAARLSQAGSVSGSSGAWSFSAPLSRAVTSGLSKTPPGKQTRYALDVTLANGSVLKALFEDAAVVRD